MERKGILSVGNWIEDTVKFVDSYPAKGNLVTIRSIEAGLGGCAHNVLVDLAALESGIPLYAGGCIGNDASGKRVMDTLEKYGIDGTNMVVLDGAMTSGTDVISEIGGEATRTFFHFRGANALLTPEHVLSCASPAKIFHLGYLLLLDQLDQEDPEWGVVAARVLKALQDKGYKTSVDVVSEEGDRFRKIILPCLKYTDYFIVNEVEAGACCGRNLRDANGDILWDEVEKAAAELLDQGIGALCIIHFPEGGVAVSKNGESCRAASDRLPKEEIVSTVGAGDAFCAGSLYAIHEGFGMKEMLAFANACARFNLKSATSTGGAVSAKTVRAYLDTIKQ